MSSSSLEGKSQNSQKSDFVEKPGCQDSIAGGSNIFQNPFFSFFINFPTTSTTNPFFGWKQKIQNLEIFSYKETKCEIVSEIIQSEKPEGMEETKKNISKEEFVTLFLNFVFFGSTKLKPETKTFKAALIRDVYIHVYDSQIIMLSIRLIDGVRHKNG